MCSRQFVGIANIGIALWALYCSLGLQDLDLNTVIGQPSPN
jgi:hypothetical protein